MLSNARRLAIPCALISIVLLIAGRSYAQPHPERIQRLVIGPEWLGHHPDVKPDWNVAHPLWEGRGAFFVEQRLTQRAVRSWWPQRLADAKAGAILDGFAWYLSTRSVERDFDALYFRTAHSADVRPYFGGHMIWSFPTLRLSRHTVAQQDRYAAVFDSLERWIGTPALRSAMFEVARLPLARLQADVIVKTISDAAGQDVSWTFDAATTDVNYAVDAVSEQSVTVSRRGSGMFTGRAAQRVGDFDSGDAIQIKVVFADGTSTLTTWDGRDQTRTFTFQGPSPIVAAYLDPDRIVTLDNNRLDNAIVPRRPTNVPVRKWTARWMVWLQHTMLSYGFLA